MTQDWWGFASKSESEYRNVMHGQGMDRLRDHNILIGCEEEIEFMETIIALHGGSARGGRALDLCCGAGTMTDALQRRGYDSTGVELSETAVGLGLRLWPRCTFIQADTTDIEALPPGPFDLILAREAHPFSRVDDWKMQRPLIAHLLSQLRLGGGLVIAHARVGGGMSTASVNFQRMKREFLNEGFRGGGVYSHFPFKHLRFRPPGLRTLGSVSRLGILAQRILRYRWLEFVVLVRVRAGAATQCG